MSQQIEKILPGIYNELQFYKLHETCINDNSEILKKYQILNNIHKLLVHIVVNKNIISKEKIKILTDIFKKNNDALFAYVQDKCLDIKILKQQKKQQRLQNKLISTQEMSPNMIVSLTKKLTSLSATLIVILLTFLFRYIEVMIFVAKSYTKSKIKLLKNPIFWLIIVISILVIYKDTNIVRKLIPTDIMSKLTPFFTDLNKLNTASLKTIGQYSNEGIRLLVQLYGKFTTFMSENIIENMHDLFAKIFTFFEENYRIFIASFGAAFFGDSTTNKP